MSIVLFLGAGASHPAGYPLTAELLNTVGREADASPFTQYKSAWQEWRGFVDNVPAALRLVLKSPNPEVALSLPDLFALAVATEDDYRVRSAFRTLRDEGISQPAELEAYFDGKDRGILNAAGHAKNRLVEALHWFFLFRHGQDCHADRSTRRYLTSHLAALGPGTAS